MTTSASNLGKLRMVMKMRMRKFLCTALNLYCQQKDIIYDTVNINV